ncbi:hypothetical protein [Streptomyces sp. NPDC047000]|uniref:hypothetical protein n=1 Tax=Streptomyces sp. NPDC047000 TaxID=3155474 RepID=UPI0033F2B305
MELRSVEELMDLLHARRGTGGAAPDRDGVPAPDPRRLALRTAALLRRARPADKELQVAGLVLDVARLLGPDTVRGLLGGRVAALVRHHRDDAARHRPDHGAAPDDDDVLRLRQAAEEARLTPFDAGVLEDWRTVLEMVAERHSALGAVD